MGQLRILLHDKHAATYKIRNAS